MHNRDRRCNRISSSVERWGANPDSDGQGKSDDIDRYQISVDGKELKSTNVAGPKEKTNETKEGDSEANPESSKAKEEETNEAKQESSEAKEEETSDAKQENSEAEESSEEGGETTGAIVARTRVHDQVTEEIGHSRAKSDST
jgi:hypothetical protein